MCCNIGFFWDLLYIHPKFLNSYHQISIRLSTNFIQNCWIAWAQLGEGEPLPVGVGWFLVRVLFLFVLVYDRSWGPLGWLVPSEIFPLETRSAGQSMVVCMNLLFTALIAQCFLVSLRQLKYGIFLLFAGLIFIMTAFIYFLLPETKQVPVEESLFVVERSLVLEKVCWWSWSVWVGQAMKKSKNCLG